MNFAFTLLLFEIFWLPTNFTKVTDNENICKAFAIIEHYFLLASFFSMVVIAHHTRKVFGKNLPAPKMSPGHERKLFYAYLCLVWIIPALFIAICVVLDSEEIINLGYGETDICWLTGTNSYVYFVTIPVILMLMFNVVEFVRTAIQLRKHAQNQAGLTASGKRSSNLSIYIRLSTLMGFTWLFGLLGQVVTSTSVFYYLFVIFTSLEGFFVAWAFVLNAKTLNLYRHRFRNTETSSSSNITAKKSLPKSDHNDTKL
ncbi:adhesion G-protein coupled receptor G2-like [Xenia sp. Carnegie-2017]|uniref:adhesion G-protein coupled receptor G2-like n=1 Tax=Xenia sp. Carnegie-2017 TaxID=2897299 RepID=UPI001F04890E|nr:adhesion G-protein coupled receptor G2-like [Xenia sp. Carnegie-2017]